MSALGQKRTLRLVRLMSAHCDVRFACVADPKFTARTLELGYIPFVSTQAEFAAFVVESTEKWAKVIQAVGIKVE